MLFQQLPCQVGLGRSIHASIFQQSGGYRTMRRRGEAPFCGKGSHWRRGTAIGRPPCWQLGRSSS
jgi:hypothetical protein